MRQRKKIKYVQKQPPDKTEQKQEARTSNIPPKREGVKVEANTDRQAYLIAPNNKPKGRRIKNEPMMPPKYVARESSQFEDSCLVCSEGIARKEWIWTCRRCCVSMHLKCIKQWILNLNAQLDRRATKIFTWKCPQCNEPYDEPMPKYYCYCSKVLNPEYEHDLPAHSCGEICQKKRGPNCPHLCPLPCHKGKCPPCKQEGALVSCHCGQSQRATRCGQLRDPFQCGKKCGMKLACGKHRCERNCHPGQCQPCKKMHMAECYCGKNSDIIECALPSYSCEELCAQKLDCGHHSCEQKCHEGQCKPCAKIPALQTTCPCGKYTIQMLTGDAQFRQSCADPIPVCGMPCGKKLECGHACSMSCHDSMCGKCKVIVDQPCNCGSTSRKIECWRREKEPFTCESICKKRLSCGHHVCNTTCCPFRNSPFVENHQCPQTCKKMLNCGQHQCDEPCHMGLCKKCPVVYSQAQPCPCGKTSLRPPVLCGTVMPQCDNICDKEMLCGHKCEQTCHYGPCRCFAEVEVSCRCGKERVMTTCGKEALCLNFCQIMMPCGHKCGLQCHTGTCEEAHKKAPCRKSCNRERKDCSHLCQQLCHPDKKCEVFPCQAQILVKCDCGHRQTMALCGAQNNVQTRKSIVCNKKCENLKRFDVLYKNKEVYYPGNMVQFAFKNFTYLQNLEARLQKFILHSDENFLEVEFRFQDHHLKVLLTTLFENHYHLNSHYYRVNKYSAFTLTQGDHTLIPRPTLSDYAKGIAKGTIKQNNLPFEFTIGFECDQKNKLDNYLNAIIVYKHGYYLEWGRGYVSLHFWNGKEGQNALQILQNEYQTMDFRCSYNTVKEEEEILASQITEAAMTEEELEELKNQRAKTVKKSPNQQQAKPSEPVKEQPKEFKEAQIVEPKVEKKEGVFIPAPPARNQSEEPKGPRLIMRNKGVPTFRKNDYPEAKQNVQDIYLIDEDELYNEKIDWLKLSEKLCSKKMGPEASEWRLRALLMINTFQPLPESMMKARFDQLVQMYNKDKESAMRILEIQRMDKKIVQGQMASSGIYLSDHEPEMIGYLSIYNYLAEDKIPLQLPEILTETADYERCHEAIQAVQAKNPEEFFSVFRSVNYVMACAMLPLVHLIRQSTLEELSKGGRIRAKDLYKHLLFSSEEALLKFALENGIEIKKRVSKSTREEIYYANSGSLIAEPTRDISFIAESIYIKRDKKYFLNEPEELVEDKYVTRSFFAFGDFKESVSKSYMMALVKALKEQE